MILGLVGLFGAAYDVPVATAAAAAAITDDDKKSFIISRFQSFQISHFKYI
jgi:hypothetical protein